MGRSLLGHPAQLTYVKIRPRRQRGIPPSGCCDISLAGDRRGMGSGAGFGAPLLDRPIADITTLDVVAVLETVWHDKPEVARKLQVRSEWPERKAAGPFYRPAMSAEWKTARCEI